MKPRLSAIALVAALSLALTAIGPAPVATASVATTERVYLPPGGSVTVAGHGFGHGRGLSQWGARGAASQGIGYQRILDFYYPGTARVTQANSELRVLISGDTDNELRVRAEPGMTASDSHATNTPIDLPGDVRQWRVERRADGFWLSGFVDGRWVAWSRGPSPGFMTLKSQDGTLRLVRPDGTEREYRGALRAVPHGSAPGQRTVNLVAMESYLRSVVPAESPASWPADALRAQAVAARTYASRDRSSAPNSAWHTCDTTACQVYSGYRSFSASGALTTTHEAASTDAAIAATANQVLHYGGSLAFTQFSASNGGWTAAGSHPYQVAKADPWDAVGNPVHSWKVTVTTQTIRDAYPQVGAPRYVEVRRRTGNGDWGGRVLEAVIAGSSGSVTVSGGAFRTALGLRSDWWKVTGSTRLDSDTTADGRPDLVAAMTDGTLRTYAGTGTGTFAGWRQIGHGWSGMRLLVRANDLTGDGRSDLLAVDGAGVMWRYESNGQGGLRSAIRVGSGWDAFRFVVAPGDIDGDGASDLLAVDNSGVMWRYLGRGDGTFSARQRVGSGWGAMTAVVGGGDWTGDGRADFLARTADGRLLLYRGLGGGAFASEQIGNGWAGMRLLTTVGDWNGDSNPDILAADGAGALHLYRWTGSGFQPRQTVGNGWNAVRLLP